MDNVNATSPAVNEEQIIYDENEQTQCLSPEILTVQPSQYKITRFLDKLNPTCTRIPLGVIDLNIGEECEKYHGVKLEKDNLELQNEGSQTVVIDSSDEDTIDMSLEATSKKRKNPLACSDIHSDLEFQHMDVSMHKNSRPYGCGESCNRTILLKAGEQEIIQPSNVIVGDLLHVTERELDCFADINQVASDYYPPYVDEPQFVLKEGPSNAKPPKRPIFSTRCIPMTFCDFIATLSPLQRSVVADMGFANLLDVKPISIDRRLISWFVENFDPVTEILKVIDGKLVRISYGDVADILGLPRTGESIYLVEGSVDYISPIRPHCQSNMLDVADGHHFRKLFLQMACCTFLDPVRSKNGTPSLNELIDITLYLESQNYNWSEFVYRRLKEGICNSCVDALNL